MRLFSFIGSMIKAVFMLVIIIFIMGLIGLIFGERQKNGNIAVVEIKGPIEETAEVIKDIKDYRDASHVKAIILRVDSPGGAVGSSQEVYDEVIKTKAVKPVIVSFGNVAASGGYYVAASASKIVSNPGTITGSIGVITQFFQVDEVLKKFNLKWEIIKSGPNKDIGSPLRSMTPEEKKLIQSMVSDVYDQFVTAVAEGRGLKKEDVVQFADGRIFSGKKAKELGLVDELGGIEKAIEVAVAEAKITDEPKVIYPSKEKYKFLEQFAEGKLSMPSLFKLEYRLP
ncbi:MAG: signal peptide peptidase SppA [Proteobacteria bacterium]|nr:signal peptide peptidase SppA [Pseudomonadota bacterium]